MPIQLLDDEQTIDVRDSDLGVANSDPEIVYTVRVLTPQYWRKTGKQFTKRRPGVGGRMEETFDAAGFSDAVWDYVLKAWSPGAMLWKGQAVGADESVTLADGTQAKAKYQLDRPRKEALLEIAGMNTVVQKPDEQVSSFRPTV